MGYPGVLSTAAFNNLYSIDSYMPILTSLRRNYTGIAWMCSEHPNMPDIYRMHLLMA